MRARVVMQVFCQASCRLLGRGRIGPKGWALVRGKGLQRSAKKGPASPDDWFTDQKGLCATALVPGTAARGRTLCQQAARNGLAVFGNKEVWGSPRAHKAEDSRNP